jgi:hypothetical protein
VHSFNNIYVPEPPYFVSSGRLPQNINFLYDGNAIEIVNEFTYLGLNFSRTGSFTNAKKALINKAYINILRIRKAKGFLLVVLLCYMENILTFRHYIKHEI